MTIKEYLDVSEFETLDEVEIDVWRDNTQLNNKNLTVKQMMKSKLKDLEVKKVSVYVSGCGSWGGFVRLDINVK